MYFVLYDRQLNSFDGSYVLESWTRTQRAYDFDTMEFVGEMVNANVEPFFVVAFDYKGKVLFGGLCGNPELDETARKSKIVVKDYLTLFNTEMIIDMNSFKKLGELFTYIINNCECGFSNILVDTTDIDNIEIEYKADKGNLMAYDVIAEQMKYYGLYAVSELDINLKKIKIKFAKLGGKNSKKIRLKDFGIDRIEKSIGEITRVTVFSAEFNKIDSHVLGKDNKIYKEPTDVELVYPLKNRNFIASSNESKDIEQAQYDAIMELSNSRYQENINIHDKFDFLTDVDFSYLIEVSTENGIYKTLPLGEIETNSKGKRLLKIGYRPQLLTQIL